MIVLMMAAGAGSRFGEGIPKPFREVRPGVPMWKFVAKELGFDQIDDLKTLVVQDAHSHLVSEGEDFYDLFDDTTIIRPMIEQGPAWSVMSAIMTVHETQDLLIVDCDCFISGGWDELLQITRSRLRLETDVAIFCVQNNGPTRNDCSGIIIDNSYNTVNGPLNTIEKITEKQVAGGQHINIGAYWFRNTNTFKHALQKAPKDKEVTLTDLVRTFREERTEAVVLEGTFHNLGTPELLTAFQEGLPAFDKSKLPPEGVTVFRLGSDDKE